VAGLAELGGEPADPVGEALRVMEHDDVGHGCSPEVCVRAGQACQ
jgi:hypothetical protein